jgi:cell surface protein SprA
MRESHGAFNVPRGSVVVTAGGRVLVEGVDYSVNYQLGEESNPRSVTTGF